MGRGVTHLRQSLLHSFNVRLDAGTRTDTCTHLDTCRLPVLPRDVCTPSRSANKDISVKNQ